MNDGRETRVSASLTTFTDTRALAPVPTAFANPPACRWAAAVVSAGAMDRASCGEIGPGGRCGLARADLSRLSSNGLTVSVRAAVSGVSVGMTPRDPGVEAAALGCLGPA